MPKKSKKPKKNPAQNFQVIDCGDVEINPEEFRVPAQDMHGHNARSQAYIQPGHMTMIDNIIQSKKFPYRTKSDMIRHAIYRHLRWLRKLGAIDSVTGQVDMIIETLREDEFNKDFIEVFDKLAQAIQTYMGRGEVNQAIRCVMRAHKHIDGMPETPNSYWKDRYKAELHERFGYIMKHVDKPSDFGSLDSSNETE